MKIHTVVIGDGETLEDALKRVLGGDKAPERDEAEVLKDRALTWLDTLLGNPDVTGYLYSATETKLGRKPMKKTEHVSILPGSLLTMPITTIDLADKEWFAAMTVELHVVLNAMMAVKLDQL